MNSEEKIKALEAKVKWNKKHLRIVFVLSVVTFLMLAGHFVLHATGKV